MSDGTKAMIEATLEIAKRDDCHKELLPSDIRRVCNVALKKIDELEKCYSEIADKEALIHEQHKQVMKKVEPRPYDEHDKRDGNWNYIHQEDVASAFVNCKKK